MSNIKGQKRYDSHGKALRPGELQRPTGTYQYQYKGTDNKWHRISATTLTDLREKEKQIQRDVLDGLNTSKQVQTLNSIYEKWKSVKRGLKPNVFSNYTYMYDRFVKPDLGKWELKAIRKSDVKAFYNRLVDEKNIQVNTVDSIHTVVHQVFQLAVDDDIIRYNPSDNCLAELKRSFTQRKVKALTKEEQDRFLDFLKNNEKFQNWYPIFATFLMTGMRVGELTGLRWEDINSQTHEISVNHTLVYYADSNRKQRYAINSTKTPASFRTIPYGQPVVEALRLLVWQKGMPECKSSIEDDKGNIYTNFVFLNRFGQVFNQEALNRALRERIIPQCNAEAIEKNGKMKLGETPLAILPNFSCHNLRHTFCTNLCAAGVDIKEIQEIMGHSDINTTMSIYAEATKEKKHGAIKSLAEYLGTDKFSTEEMMK